MEPIEVVLALWEEDIMAEREVIAWADEKILSMDSPSHDLIELSLHGPSECVKKPEYQFPTRPAKLSYSQRFALKASTLDTSSDSAVKDFVIWICRNVLDVDLNYYYNMPEVGLGIYVEDLVSDYGDIDGAMDQVRKDIPALMDRCKTISKDLFGKCG
jgi:hypothetical protein